MKHIFRTLAFLVLSAIAAPAQNPYATVTWTNIMSGGVPLPSGRACFTPVNLAGVAIPAVFPGGTLTKTPVCGRIVNGVMLPVQLLKSTVTNPLNLAYSATITDASNGAVILGASLRDGYGALQIPGDVDINTIGPNIPGIPLVGQATQGPPGHDGLNGRDGVNGVGVPLTDASLQQSTSAVIAQPAVGSAGQVMMSTDFLGEPAVAENCVLLQTRDYTGAVSQNKYCRQDNLVSKEPGWNGYTLGGSERHHIVTARAVDFRDHSAGIANALNVTGRKLGGGDAQWVNAYCQAVSYWGTGGDEGILCARHSLSEITALPQGTIITGGTGLTSFITNCTANCGNLGAQQAVVNTTPAKVITATATAISAANYGPGQVVTLTFPAASFPVTSCGTLAGGVDTPQVRINEKSTPLPFILSGLTAGFSVGQVLTVNGPEARENITVASITVPFNAGTQTFTAGAGYAHSAGGRVCGGGLAGYFAEQKMLTTASGSSPYLIYVLETPTPTTAIVAYPNQGHFSVDGLFPSGTNLPDAGVYRFYQGTTVTDATQAYNAGTGPFNFGAEVNRFTWGAGDTWAEYASAGALFQAAGDSLYITNPYSADTGVHYARINGATLNGVRGYRSVNQTPASMYRGQGGPYAAGPLIEGTAGVYSSAAFLQFYPQAGKISGNFFGPCLVGCFFSGGMPSGFVGPHRFAIFGDYATTRNNELGYNWDDGTLDWNGPVRYRNLGAGGTATTAGYVTADSNGGLSIGTAPAGTPGPAGATGPQGPAGPAGSGASNDPTYNGYLSVATASGGTDRYPAAGTPLFTICASRPCWRNAASTPSFIYLDATGTPGPAGPAGAAGPVGPAGAQGPQGPAGTTYDATLNSYYPLLTGSSGDAYPTTGGPWLGMFGGVPSVVKADGTHAPLGNSGSAFAMSYKGLYSSSTTYGVNDLVSDVSGDTWISESSGNTNNAPALGSSFWLCFGGCVTTNLGGSISATNATVTGDVTFTNASNSNYCQPSHNATGIALICIVPAGSNDKFISMIHGSSNVFGVDGSGNITSSGSMSATSYHEVPNVPASSIASCSVGDFTDGLDGSTSQPFHYYCYAANHWVRSAYSAF